MDARSMVGQEVIAFSSGSGRAVNPLLGIEQGEQPLLFSTSSDGWGVHRWNLPGGGRVWCDGEGMSECNDQALVPLPGGGLSLAVATEDGIEWWDARTGR